MSQSSSELVLVRKLRNSIPRDSQVSDDSRMEWLWDQRLAVVGSIYLRSPSIRDRMAAKVVLDAAMSANLPSIELLLLRLEGGAVTDQAIVEDGSLIL